MSNEIKGKQLQYVGPYKGTWLCVTGCAGDNSGRGLWRGRQHYMFVIILKRWTGRNLYFLPCQCRIEGVGES